MTVRTDPCHRAAGRLTTRLFPARARRAESAFCWLASDPVFAKAVTDLR